MNYDAYLLSGPGGPFHDVPDEPEEDNMAEMTGRGMKLWSLGFREKIEVAIGDQVRMSSGHTGRAHRWTGIGVAIDPDDALYFNGYRVVSFEATDGDIMEIVETVEQREAREHPEPIEPIEPIFQPDLGVGD